MKLGQTYLDRSEVLGKSLGQQLGSKYVYICVQYYLIFLQDSLFVYVRDCLIYLFTYLFLFLIYTMFSNVFF